MFRSLQSVGPQTETPLAAGCNLSFVLQFSIILFDLGWLHMVLRSMAFGNPEARIAYALGPFGLRLISRFISLKSAKVTVKRLASCFASLTRASYGYCVSRGIFLDEMLFRLRFTCTRRKILRVLQPPVCRPPD